MMAVKGVEDAIGSLFKTSAERVIVSVFVVVSHAMFMGPRWIYHCLSYTIVALLNVRGLGALAVAALNTVDFYFGATSVGVSTGFRGTFEFL